MQPISDHFTNVPAFLTKLWKMVSDPKTDHLICWSPCGNSFIILNQVKFWYELLPLYYKHNNMSSFVRQLNMYGFHKVSSVENGSMIDGEKDEVQFFHTYFQKDNPELLKLIKRKVTVSRHSENGNPILKGEDLSKVLSDVKQLRGKQASVDSQLAAMKQENAVLWRELAVLRQKHTKQQQIVNKLIQFLVSMVHPGNSRMGVGVKRHYPLMLRGTPKKAKTSKNNNNNNSSKLKSDGPTIHELDTEIELENVIQPDVLLNVPDDVPLIYSPLTPTSSTPSIGVVSPLNIDLKNEFLNEAERTSADNQNNADENSPRSKTKESYWDKPSYVFVENTEEDPPPNELLTDAEIPEDPILNILEDNIINEANPHSSESKVFISPSSQDTLLSNLTNGSYNLKVLNGKKSMPAQAKKVSSAGNEESGANAVNTDMTVATRKSEEKSKINSSGDLGLIIDSNQSEIDLYKDFLHGCGTLDSNALLGDANRMPFSQPDYKLFNDGALDYGFSFSQDNDFSQNSGDPMVSGQEVAPYPMLPLEELLDDSLNDTDIADEILENDISQLNTPQISSAEPEFPTEKS